MSAIVVPVPIRRLEQVRGQMPASMRRVPAGVRRMEALPEEPEARMQSSRDILVETRHDMEKGRDLQEEVD